MTNASKLVWITGCALAAALALPAAAHAADEVCGDGIDNSASQDDGYGIVDEGCYPTGVTGVCESPIDCSRIGSVSPLTGALVHYVKPDVSPVVPYGPSITLQRFYMSKYEPGYNLPSATDYRAPMGYHWSHNYMSWLDFYPNGGSQSDDEVVVHTVAGQDILFTYDQTAGGYDYYTPQAGAHFDYLRQDTTGANAWELRTLSGQVFQYAWFGNDGVGKLEKIIDTVGNEVVLAYTTNTVDGQVETVTDAKGTKKLKFIYSTSGTKLLDKVEYITGTGSGTLRLTVDYTYVQISQKDHMIDTVKLGTTTVADYDCNADNYLTSIDDGEGNALATFAYIEDSAGVTHGQVAQIQTPSGDVGYEYVSAASTKVGFHRTGTGACNDDSDCGAGNYCGGEYDPTDNLNNTGLCFRAYRTLSVSTSGGEHLVDSVTASCTSCRDAQDYSWDTTTVRIDGVKNADGDWTSYRRDDNGLVTMMIEGDDDAVATNTNPSGSRATYRVYDSNFPGKVKELRRLSALRPSGTCDDPEAANPSDTDCAKTVYTYSATTGRLIKREQVAVTYAYDTGQDSWNTDTKKTYTTDYTYDSVGRVTKIEGPGVSEETQYTYHSTGDGDGHLKEVKRRKDATTFITTTYEEYSWWGRPERITDANTKSECLVYDDQWGNVSSRRQVVNGSQTSCGSPGAQDETYTYTRDSWGRVTKITEPLDTCIHYSYDSEGRLSTIVYADENATGCDSTGDTIAYTYDDDGNREKVEYKDSSGTVTFRQAYEFHDDRRVHKEINPVATSKYKEWFYDDDGVPAEVRFEDYGDTSARTQWDVDSRNRVTSIKRFTGASTSDDWTLTQAAQHAGLPTEVVDELSHDIDFEWDDLGRKVEQVTAEAGTHYFAYDDAGNLVAHTEADGDTDEVTTVYTYDNLNRLTATDTGDANCFTQGGAEIQYGYDALPSGVSCPSGSNCSNLSGRLAYVKTQMWCDDTESDDQFDQETFYSYDVAGRIAEHTVVDDSGRTGRVVYVYDDNGRLAVEHYPDTTYVLAVWGSGGYYGHDINRLVRHTPSATSFLTSITWHPFGPPRQYYTENTFLHGETVFGIKVTNSVNLAYRWTEHYARSTYPVTPDNVFKIAYAEDDRGRYTKRDFSYGTSGQTDMFFTYDNLSRVTCRTPSSVTSCPTSGSDLVETLSYNASDDRTQLILDNSTLPATTYDTTYATQSDRIASITKDAGTQYTISVAYDDRGNRISDDDSEWENTDYDQRTYTYDARNNLITVSGSYLASDDTWNGYTVTYAYDERNRRIFKSFYDADLDEEAQWFFYYDQYGRLIEAKHTPDTDDSSTYSVYQWYWLDGRPVMYFQTDQPTSTVTRRYLYTDEQGRPLTAWDWPTSGDTSRVWEVEPGLFGWDVPTVGDSVHQPLRFPGQHYDRETEATVDCGTGCADVVRPGLADNRYRVYDSLTGTYLQVDPKIGETWTPYTYAAANPISNIDPLGLQISLNSGDSFCWGLIRTALAARARQALCPIFHPDDPHGAAQCMYENQQTIDEARRLYIITGCIGSTGQPWPLRIECTSDSVGFADVAIGSNDPELPTLPAAAGRPLWTRQDLRERSSAGAAPMAPDPSAGRRPSQTIDDWIPTQVRSPELEISCPLIPL